MKLIVKHEGKPLKKAIVWQIECLAKRLSDKAIVWQVASPANRQSKLINKQSKTEIDDLEIKYAASGASLNVRMAPLDIGMKAKSSPSRRQSISSSGVQV